MHHFPITQGSAHLPEARATTWCRHHPRPAPSLARRQRRKMCEGEHCAVRPPGQRVRPPGQRV
eukprot:5761477-Prymnesium_polylepis.1